MKLQVQRGSEEEMMTSLAGTLSLLCVHRLGACQRRDGQTFRKCCCIDEGNRRINRRTLAEESHFRLVLILHLPELRMTPLVDAVEAVRQLISILILRCTRNLPADLIRFCFDAIGLDRPDRLL
ncbi:hypothetical protein AVEN_104667-1 [Araneus ventricosus]|uniref:Uncharacterized protein n=1 Tax=Araneus ventricosus TaxID=182803 RepID=A0A4Y2BF23_ARAVE|nr:hypothetical protein AVEN_104667-1 [Araneus ventricosus]